MKIFRNYVGTVQLCMRNYANKTAGDEQGDQIEIDLVGCPRVGQ